MKKLALAIIGIALLTFWGCEQNTSGIDNEESQINEEIQSVIEDSLDIYFDALDDVSEDNLGFDEPSWLGGSNTLAKTTNAKLRFGRIGKRRVERNIRIINDTDTTATAYVYTKLVGDFVVHKIERDGDTTNINRYVKPMTHEIERIVHLKKVRNTDRPRRNWKIVDISFAVGNSPIEEVQIEELTIMAAGIDTVVITDPMDYFINGPRMFTYPRFTEVKLQVKVRNNTVNPMVFPEGTRSTESVRLHYGRNRQGHFARKNFEWIGKDGDLNVYEGTWIVKQFRGMHHAVIDVIDNGTILSSAVDAYPYVSNTWATPYRVTLF